jgi:hypothetical protein
LAGSVQVATLFAAAVALVDSWRQCRRVSIMPAAKSAKPGGVALLLASMLALLPAAI